MIRGVELAQYRNNIRQWRNKKEMQVAQVMAQLQCVLRVAFVIVNNIYCIPTYLMWMWVILLPIRKTRFYIWAEKILYRNLLLMVGYWSFSAGYVIHEVGDDIEDLYDKRTLLIANHQSTGDVPLLMACFQVKQYVCDNVMWVMDAMFKYTNFGVVSLTHGDFFITQGKDTRQSQLDTFKQHLLEVYLPQQLQWMVIFPEGGFLSKRLESSQRFAAKNGFPKLENVTLPRVGATQLALEILTDKQYLQGQAPMEYLVDLTIGYPGAPVRPLDILAIVTGYRKPHAVHFHYRKFAVKDIPFDDSNKLTTWMYDRWVEKEQLLKHFYEHGQFPSSQAEDDPSVESSPHPTGEHRRLQQGSGSASSSHSSSRIEQPRPVLLNHAYVFFVHVLWILSSLFHLALFRSAKAYLLE